MMVKGLSEADGEQANKGGPKPYFALTLLAHDPPYVSTTINFFEWDCTISCSTNEYHEHQETRMIEIEYFCSLLLWTCWSPGLCATHRHKWVCQVHATHYSIFTTPFNFTFIWRRLELLAFHFGGIQLVRTQKIGLLWPPPPLCTHFHTQRPDPLPFSTYARPDPPSIKNALKFICTTLNQKQWFCYIERWWFIGDRVKIETKYIIFNLFLSSNAW